MARVYKVVKTHGARGYQSAFIDGPLALRYRVGEWTEPEFGKIFAFRTLSSAMNFRNTIIEGRVFRADAHVSKMRVDSIVAVGGYASYSPPRKRLFRRWISSWWRDPEHVFAFVRDGSQMNRMSIPGDTVLCHRLRLVEEVGND